MSDLPQLTEADIRRWTGEESFKRGQRYFHQGAVLNPRRAGLMLKAQCQGSRPQPYRVQVTLEPREGYQTPLSIQVAQAAEKTRPQESVRIYQDAAQRLIELRGRDNYVTAATYLARVRKLYQHLGDEQTWQALIADIRKQNSSLRALKEELR